VTYVAKPHWSFWVIAAMALIWNAMGAVNWVTQIAAPDLEAMPEWWREVVASRPLWAVLAMAVAVFAGMLGAVLLLQRRQAAVLVFSVSLAGTVLAAGQAFGIGEPSPRQLFEAVLMPVAVAAFLIWYARRMLRRRSPHP